MRERLSVQVAKIQDALNENRSMMNQNSQADWREVEEGIIKRARIVCTTLSMSGIEKLEALKDQFEYLIIDEACQSTEPSALIPFALVPKRVVMVGDQK
jgi:senataxin